MSKDWNNGSVEPKVISTYEVVRNPNDYPELVWWDGNFFQFFGTKTRYSAKGVFQWRGPVAFGMPRISAEDRIKLATRTESKVTEELIGRITDEKLIRLLHAGLGLATESGEFLDGLKKYIFYGKPLDEVNLKEELGDLDWYMNLCCDALHTTMMIIEEANIKKLAKRYGDKFSEDAALLRNLGAELEVLKENL